jgi:hypothetical protein
MSRSALYIPIAIARGFTAHYGNGKSIAQMNISFIIKKIGNSIIFLMGKDVFFSEWLNEQMQREGWSQAKLARLFCPLPGY